jgi:hypothetical protein
MGTEDEITELTDKIVQRGTDWLKDAKSIHDAIPFVERTLHLSREIQSTFANYPGGLAVEKLEPIRFALEQTNTYLESWMRVEQANTVPCAVSGVGFASAAGTTVTGLLAENTSNGNYDLNSWATQFLRSLEAIQSDETTRQFITQKLASLYRGGEVVFQNSLVTYTQVKQGIGLASSAGIAFRNVLEAVLKSRLLQLARSYSGNPSIKKWSDMADAVARGGPGSPQAIQLVAQEHVYQDLWSAKLTQIAKGYVTPTVSEWEAIYSQFMSFLYTTLALVDFKDGT